MIHLYNEVDIQNVIEGGHRLCLALNIVRGYVQPGITTLELNRVGEKTIFELQCEGILKGYHGYPFVMCISVNDELIHGLPSDRVIKRGDVVKLDMVVRYRGMCIDFALTTVVGLRWWEGRRKKRLVKVTLEALYRGIYKIRDGVWLSDVCKTIQNYIDENNLSIIKEYTGHGVGREIHEEPRIPNYWTDFQRDLKLRKGMVLAIEPIVTIGRPSVYVDSSGWGVRTLDRSVGAHFEHTVIVQDTDCKIATEINFCK